MSPFDYFEEGTTIDIPEVASRIGVANAHFQVISTHRGGMGVCFRLRHIATSVDYALKCIRPHVLSEKDAVARFHDELEVWVEASACDAVAEAHAIVRINDVPSVVARWMDGGDLASALDKLKVEQKYQVLLRVIRALNWVHKSMGVIHRDLKPANILLDANNLAYVADWGLARLSKAAINEASPFVSSVQEQRPDRTARGSFLGTILYAAPEQILDAASVDHRADIYALGCIMFEMETGGPPFTGATSYEIKQKHLKQSPPSLGGFLKRTTLGLDSIILKCLAKNPSDRFSTYEELEHSIIASAIRQKISVSNCTVGERYKRHHLGKGHKAMVEALQSSPIQGKGGILIDLSDFEPFLAEAGNLIALKRFKEAEKFYARLYNPSVLDYGGNAWHSSYDLAQAYAYCLQHIEGRLEESMGIYTRLSALRDKPAEYYIRGLLKTQ